MKIPANAIAPVDPRYQQWNDRGVNRRFKGHPQFIIPVNTVNELETALQEVVQQDLYVVVRGGAHCLEEFVDNGEVQVIIDISKMKGVRFDSGRNCFEVTAGETVGGMLQKLHDEYGVVLPVGEHPDIGIGGHIPGGAFGWLCRQHGLAVDYLYAVELLWVDESKNVRSVIATKEANDPNRELWWAHTGGGAGNFGIVTRYWFRTPGANSNDPSVALPKAPQQVETFEVEWQWKDINETVFKKLVANFCEWCYQNAAPGVPASGLFCTMHLWQSVTGKIQLKGLVYIPDEADVLIPGFLQFLQNGTGISYSMHRTKMNWLDFALHPFPDIFVEGKGAFKVKDAFLLKPFTGSQLQVLYQYLTKRNDVPGCFVGLATYGGMVNTIKPDATASYQRRAVMTTACVAGWGDPEEKEKYMAFVRDFYQSLYAESGGLPLHNEFTGGCIIAHPDCDLSDPEMNKSGFPWYHFYYLDNYPRLQEVKAKWDPLNVFHHTLSIKP